MPVERIDLSFNIIQYINLFQKNTTILYIIKIWYMVSRECGGVYNVCSCLTLCYQNVKAIFVSHSLFCIPILASNWVILVRICPEKLISCRDFLHQEELPVKYLYGCAFFFERKAQVNCWVFFLYLLCLCHLHLQFMIRVLLSFVG